MTRIDDEFEDIKEQYEYDGKSKRTKVRFFPDKSIATITESSFSEDEGEMIEIGVAQEGMTREEILKYFPPRPADAKKGYIYNMALLIRSIIYEAFRKEGTSIDEGNVRNFWYTHLKKIITEKLGLGETTSVHSTINKAWDNVINSGLVTYEGLNIIGGKEQSRISIVKDSPFSNLIIAVEKADYFEFFKWIPKLFNCTLITAGGQPSRTVARAFIRKLSELGIDLDQTFYMCVASDLDPAGYYIQEAFRKQFEAAISYYGGSGNVIIRRLFVRSDQVTDELLRAQAMPCSDKAKEEAAKKAEETKWRFFCEQTSGGIYIPKPIGWSGPLYEMDGEERVRALLEMNAFSKPVIERSIVKELLNIIESTNDESKIMIPEIMRVFEEMRNETADEIYQEWHETLIKPLIDKYLSDTQRWKTDVDEKYDDEYNEAEIQKDEQTDPIDEKYDDLVEEKEQEAHDRVPGLYDIKDELTAAIRRLYKERDAVENQINEECSDIFHEIRNLNDERDSEKKPFIDEFDEEIKNTQARKDYRLNKLEQFKDEHKTVFNPLEMMLRTDVRNALTSDDLIFYFKQIEMMKRFQHHIGRLLTEPQQLLEIGTSCFDQPVPTFTEEELLQKAAGLKDENIERVRNAFSAPFTNEMKDFIRESLGDITFSLRGEVEQIDLTSEIEQAMEETESEIDEGLWEE